MSSVSPGWGAPVGDQSRGLLALLLPPPIQVLLVMVVAPGAGILFVGCIAACNQLVAPLAVTVQLISPRPSEPAPQDQVKM